jgi:hypothetical protein
MLLEPHRTWKQQQPAGLPKKKGGSNQPLFVCLVQARRRRPSRLSLSKLMFPLATTSQWFVAAAARSKQGGVRVVVGGAPLPYSGPSESNRGQGHSSESW